MAVFGPWLSNLQHFTLERVSRDVKTRSDRLNAKKGDLVTKRTYRALRMSLKLTPTELAAKLGVSHATIYRRENGKIPITKEAELALTQIVAETEEASWHGMKI